MIKPITDNRGKVMVRGGRYRTAQQARFLRRIFRDNREARAFIVSAALAYAAEAK